MYQKYSLFADANSSWEMILLSSKNKTFQNSLVLGYAANKFHQDSWMRDSGS